MKNIPMTFRHSLLATLFSTGAVLSFTGTAFADEFESDDALPETKVVAKSARQMREEAPNPVFVIGREEIDATNDLTLGDFLRRQPGIVFTGPPGDPKDIRLMGLDKGYTQILLNGEPIPGGGKERQPQVDQIPMTMIERVEIIRSPLPDQPGDGVGGAINIITREHVDETLLIRVSGGVIRSEADTRPNGNVQATWGWNAPGKSLVLPVSIIRRHELKTKPKITGLFAAGTRTSLTEEYENEDNDVREISIAPQLVLKPNARDTVTLSAMLNRNEGEKEKTRDTWASLTPAGGSNFVNGNSEFEEEDKDRYTWRLGTRWERKISKLWEAGARLGYQEAGEEKFKTKFIHDPLGAQTGTEIEDADSLADNLRTELRGVYKGIKKHNLAAGMQRSAESRDEYKMKYGNGVAQTPARGDIFNVEEEKYGLWLRDDWQFAKGQQLVSGLRYEQKDITATDSLGNVGGGNVDNTSPSFHYRWQMTPDWAMRAAVAWTFKPPKFDQISPQVQSASGINSATNPDVSGNPDLAPESALGFDLGFDYAKKKSQTQVGINFSERRIEDLVAEDVQFETVSGRWVQRPYNLPGTSIVQTAAVDGRYSLSGIGLRGVVLTGNGSRFWSEAYDPVTGTRGGRVKDQPRYAWNVGADWGIPGTEVVLGARYNHLPVTVKTNGDIESGQTILDTFASWTLSQRYTLRFNATNLLDTSKLKDKPKYDASGSLTERAQELEKGGRKFLLSLDMRY